MEWTNNHFVDLGIIVFATLLYLAERARFFFYSVVCVLVIFKGLPWITSEMIKPSVL